jgi:hypothetical protein
MNRMPLVALLGLAMLGSTLAGAGVAHAAPKKKKAKQAQVEEAPQSAEIASSMAELKWGSERDQVLQRFVNAVKEKYKPKLAKATGAIEEDKLRAQMRDEISRIKDSVVEFNGKKTGWDVSFLKGEFTHHNDESLFAVTDEASQNYYFFINGKLWKWYKAFNAKAFAGKSFDQFAEAIQGRYGKSTPREGELTPGAGKQRWLEWQDPSTRLRAVDNGQFYGFYCLVFEDKDTVRRLPELRRNTGDTGPRKHELVESVTNAEDEAAHSDGNQDIVDRITGKIRNRQDAPKQADSGKTPRPGSSSSSSGKSAPPSPPPEGEDNDDPLRGLL